MHSAFLTQFKYYYQSNALLAYFSVFEILYCPVAIKSKMVFYCAQTKAVAGKTCRVLMHRCAYEFYSQTRKVNKNFLDNI